MSLIGLGTTLGRMGDTAAAGEHLKRAVAILERAIGPDHPDTRAARQRLAELSRPGA
jgi:hypothetical protein